MPYTTAVLCISFCRLATVPWCMIEESTCNSYLSIWNSLREAAIIPFDVTRQNCCLTRLLCLIALNRIGQCDHPYYATRFNWVKSSNVWIWWRQIRNIPVDFSHIVRVVTIPDASLQVLCYMWSPLNGLTVSVFAEFESRGNVSLLKK